MSNVDTAETTETLYDVLVRLTKTPREPDQPLDNYKMGLVKYFEDSYPSDEDFGELPGEVQDWVNATATVAKKNRGATRPKPLPAIDGLEEEKEAPKKRGRKPSADKVAKVAKVREPKVPGPGRYLRAMRVLMNEPTMADQTLADRIGVGIHCARYCIKAFNAATIAFSEAGYVKK
jgi:hypothetical protein